jgi:hypothetical protein
LRNGYTQFASPLVCSSAPTAARPVTIRRRRLSAVNLHHVRARRILLALALLHVVALCSFRFAKCPALLPEQLLPSPVIISAGPSFKFIARSVQSHLYLIPTNMHAGSIRKLRSFFYNKSYFGTVVKSVCSSSVHRWIKSL